MAITSGLLVSEADSTAKATVRVTRHAQAMEAAVRSNDLKQLSAAVGRRHRSLHNGACDPVLLNLIG